MNSGTAYRIADVWGNNGNDVFALTYIGVVAKTRYIVYIILHYDGSSWSTAASSLVNIYLAPVSGVIPALPVLLQAMIQNQEKKG
jgi:hypothetical protein